MLAQFTLHLGFPNGSTESNQRSMYYVVMPRSNLIVVIMSCVGIVMHSLFVNCLDVIRLASKLSIFHGEDTILVNSGP